MKKLILILIALTLCGCAASPAESSAPETTIPVTTAVPTTVPPATVPETTVPPTTIAPTTAPTEPLFPDGMALEEVIEWFDEVVLHIEYSHGSGDPSLVQKWLSPIRCRIHGDPTEEDLRVLEDFFGQLNEVPGFPGIALAAEDEFENLNLYFYGEEQFREEFSAAVNGEDAWGAAQFWYYTDLNELYEARIGYRTDIPQLDRSSILLEEIVNCIGLTDTELREDSIVYQYSNENLELSDEDWLILKLLYHPDIRCGMNAEECHAVIESLYP